LPEWINILKAKSLQKPILGNAKLKGLGVVISLAIVAIAIFALTHVIKKVDYNEVLAVVSHTAPGVVALALLLVACSYGSLTIYDLLALRTIGRTDVPYRIAALASFTSYPVAHGIGAVALISPVIRYRIYSSNGLGPLDVANICFLTGLTFWLGNLTAFGLSVMLQPDAISQIDYLPLLLNRWLAAALLLGVAVFLFWTWRSPRNIGSLRWPVRLPSGPMVLLQIVIGIFDLGAAALAMYVLIPPEAHVGLLPVAAVFIVATLLGFASHAPAGLGVFDATILIGLGGEDKEPLIAALLMFRLLYHVLPFVLALGLFGAVEGWRSISNRRIKLEPDHPSDDQRETQQADRIGRLAVEQHAHDAAADRADAGPDRVGCAERQ
jgi:glycosyltransferase 2 family protein